MILSPGSPPSPETREPPHPQLAALVFLAGTIDMKQDKLEQAYTPAHKAQLRSQLVSLTANFQRQYHQWLEGAEK